MRDEKVDMTMKLQQLVKKRGIPNIVFEQSPYRKYARKSNNSYSDNYSILED